MMIGMRRSRSGWVTAVAAAAVIPLVSPALLDAEERSRTLADVQVSSTGVDFVAAVDHGGAILRVSGGGEDHVFTFGPGESPWLSAFDAAGEPLADDVYTWELQLLPLPEDRAELMKAAAENDGLAPQALPRQSGSFAIAGGFLADPAEVEPSSPPQPRSRHDAEEHAAPLRDPREPRVQYDDDAATLAGLVEPEVAVTPAPADAAARDARPSSADSDASALARGVATAGDSTSDND